MVAGEYKVEVIELEPCTHHSLKNFLEFGG